MTQKRLYRVDWIEESRAGRGLQISSIYAKNMLGACNQIMKRENFVDVLCIKFNGIVDGKRQSISSVKDYDNMKN